MKHTAIVVGNRRLAAFFRQETLSLSEFSFANENALVRLFGTAQMCGRLPCIPKKQ